MRKTWKLGMRAILLTLGLVLAAGIGPTAAIPQTAPQCFEVDNGSGTVSLPPAGCQYMTAQDVHKVAAGLPPGTEIILSPLHNEFSCLTAPCGTPGGTLGGEVETFASTAIFQATGTGALAGFSRLIAVPLNVETHTAPRTPGDPIQSFATDMYRIEGGISGDPDFASLKFVGGTANGFHSPGHTTLTLQPDGTFLVDSTFHVNFVIDFVGAGRTLGQYRGRTVGRVTMKAIG